MENNRQQRDQWGQQSNWDNNDRQQDQWRDAGNMDTNYNAQNVSGNQPGYGETYHGNLKQREEETNRAQGHNYGRQSGGNQGQGGMFGNGGQQYGYGQNRGGYGQVGNTGGGHEQWDSHGSSGHDMGRNYEDRMGGRGQMGGYGNQDQYRQSSGYGASGSYGQQRGGSDYMNRNRQNDNDNSWWDRTKSEVRSWFNDDNSSNNEGRNRNYGMYEGGMAGGSRNIGSDRMQDSENRGQHWGKGPKGYQRSEDRIREDVCERLAYDGHVDASNIDVKVEGSEVVLTGTVRSRAEKRRAEDLVDAIMGVRNVENRIRVEQEQGSGGWQQAGSQHRSYEESSRTGSRENRGTDTDRFRQTSNTEGGSLESRSYTGNSGDGSGIGTESGTTNEIIRNSGATDTNL